MLSKEMMLSNFHFLCSYISFSYYYTMKKNHSEAKGNIKYLQRALCTSVLRLLPWQLLNTLWPLKLWWKIHTYFHWKSHKWNYLTICLVLTWIQFQFPPGPTVPNCIILGLLCSLLLSALPMGIWIWNPLTLKVKDGLPMESSRRS